MIYELLRSQHEAICASCRNSRNSPHIRNPLIYCVNRYFRVWDGPKYILLFLQAETQNVLLTLISYYLFWINQMFCINIV